jgi:BirA family biotin operon repressor/biotin-[acetyl-CoA-carboxylase] ligase
MIDEKILTILRNNTEGYVSSDEMCKVTGISRAAVWKHIEQLRAEGYDIEASPHLGYRLVSVPDSFIPAEIKWKLKVKTIGSRIISYRKVDSTNDIAYALADKAMAEGTVVLAEEQAKGKGRHGRIWISPPKGGVYMSIILRPRMAPSEIPKITLLAAVAVSKAVRSLTALEALIKWPNDILVDGKKVCGILTEMKAQQDAIDFIIVGIGINVNTPVKNLPKDASSLKELSANTLSRVELVKKVLEEFDTCYSMLKTQGFKNIINEWKQLSEMIGARVKVRLANRSIEGQVHTLDPDGSLVIRVEPGVLEKVSSGDVVMVR